ncbi:prolyl oligopeptidase family serine peptidase [Inquilinus limosus]|uniref:S9 family peptidase n=1 Tax=Inquilinus limosus TaxID=171674 RepID=UPI003F18810D
MSIDPGFLDRLIAAPRLLFPAVSPDGRWVAWLWNGKEEGNGPWVAPTAGDAPPRLLLEPNSGWDCESFSWAPDSLSLVVARRRDGEEQVGLRRVRLDPARPAETLLPDRPGYYVYTAQQHPDGRRLVYAASRDPATGLGGDILHLYEHDIATGAQRVLASPRRSCKLMPKLDPTGRRILYLRNDHHPSGRALWVYDLETGTDRELYSPGGPAKAEGVWSPDGSRVAFVAEGPTHKRLGLIDPATDDLRWLIDDPAIPVEHVRWPHQADGGQDLLVVIESGAARDEAGFLMVSTGAYAPVFRGGDILRPIAPLPDGRWVLERGRATAPTDIVTLAAEAPDQLTAHQLSPLPEGSLPDPAELSPAEPFWWHSVDGLRVQGWLYRAKGEARGAVIHVHGGPTAHYDGRFDPIPQALCRAGFHVLQPNYRGSTGLGLAYQEAIKVDGWGGREQEDIRTGILALMNGGLAEPGRVGITGLSYGGYSAWWAITHFPRDVIAASAPICGMTDLVTDYWTTRPDLRPYSEAMMGGTPDELPEKYRERSPIHFVDRIEGRLLIVQGLTDPNVTPEHVEIMRAALDALGKPYETLLFPDEGHGIVKPENCRVLYERLIAFFAEAFAVGPQKTPASSAATAEELCPLDPDVGPAG